MQPRAWLLLILAVAPLMAYAGLVLWFAVDIPLEDDYDGVLYFLNHAAAAESFPWAHLFAQHNEHRIAWTRFVTLAVCRLFGYVDFRVLITVGNLPLPIAAWIFARASLRGGVAPVAFLPIPYLLLQPQSWENMTWAMAALQNFYVVFFAALTLIAWQRGTFASRSIALALGTLATFTSGNGFVIWPVLLIWEAGRWWPRDTTAIAESRSLSPSMAPSLMRIAIVAGLFLLISVGYFRGYVSPPHHPSLLSELHHPLRLIAYMAAMQGAFLGELGRSVAIAVGCLQMVGLGCLVATRYERRNPVVFYLLLFCLGTAVLAALGRAGFGVAQAMSYRYRILSVVAITLYYWAFLEQFPRGMARASIQRGVILAACTLFVLMTGKAAIRMEQRKQRLERGVATWREHGEGLAYPDAARASQVLRESLERGVYRLPPE